MHAQHIHYVARFPRVQGRAPATLPLTIGRPDCIGGDPDVGPPPLAAGPDVVSEQEVQDALRPAVRIRGGRHVGA